MDLIFSNGMIEYGSIITVDPSGYEISSFAGKSYFVWPNQIKFNHQLSNTIEPASESTP